MCSHFVIINVTAVVLCKLVDYITILIPSSCCIHYKVQIMLYVQAGIQLKNIFVKSSLFHITV